jgi:hypothetical protein
MQSAITQVSVDENNRLIYELNVETNIVGRGMAKKKRNGFVAVFLSATCRHLVM